MASRYDKFEAYADSTPSSPSTIGELDHQPSGAALLTQRSGLLSASSLDTRLASGRLDALEEEQPTSSLPHLQQQQPQQGSSSKPPRPPVPALKLITTAGAAPTLTDGLHLHDPAESPMTPLMSHRSGSDHPSNCPTDRVLSPPEAAETPALPTSGNRFSRYSCVVKLAALALGRAAKVCSGAWLVPHPAGLHEVATTLRLGVCRMHCMMQLCAALGMMLACIMHRLLHCLRRTKLCCYIGW